jgi:class 3 adenylate cyclase
LGDLLDLAVNVLTTARTHARTAKEKLSLERILSHLNEFVPETVRRMVEKNPASPEFDEACADLTVLFLDVAGYTKISALYPPQTVNYIIERYFSAFLEIIYAFGGDMNETAGDGLMAIFRGEAEDHAMNASRAALEIRRRTGELNRELKDAIHPLLINTGINTGVAAVGMRRFRSPTGARAVFTATGPTTNLAARIASAARHGDILVGPETARRIGDRCTLFDRGFMSFKNIDEKVRVYSLIPLED